MTTDDQYARATYYKLLVAAKASKVLFTDSFNHREKIRDRTVYWTLSRLIRTIDYLIAVLEKFHIDDCQFV